MSASLRKLRADLYTYGDAGSGGVVDAAYSRAVSTDSDGQWWCSRGVPSGRERTLVAQPEHDISAIFGFAADAPVTVDGAIRCDGVSYQIAAILPRDYGRDEIQVLAWATVDLNLTAS